MQMQYWSLTDPGCVRSQNQDACRVEQLDRNSILCVVCDGMGGAKAGNVASALAVDIRSSASSKIPHFFIKKNSLL